MANIEAFRFRKAISSSINQNLILFLENVNVMELALKLGLLGMLKLYRITF